MSGMKNGIERSLSKTVSVLLVLFWLAAPAQATNDQTQRPLFQDDEKLQLIIDAPFKRLFNELRDADEYVDGTLTILKADGSTSTLPIKVKTRGKSRRKSSVCNFPPLRINFPKEATKDTIFEGQDKLKLVTHCQNLKSRYQEYYLQEHTIYQTYNILTDVSFQARLSKIDYRDSNGKFNVEGKYGFFIEDIDHVAERVGLQQSKAETVKIQQINAQASSRFALFQYFIGNLDWAFLGGPDGEACCHNSKLLLDQNGLAVHVPYDFDHAGVVDADYAQPPEGLPVRSVRDRLYRGLCAHNGEVSGVIDQFNNLRPEIYAVIETSNELSKSRIKKTLIYYDKFYQTINDHKQLDLSIYKKCRG